MLQCGAHDCFTDQDAQIDQQESIDGPNKRNAHLGKSSRDPAVFSAMLISLSFTYFSTAERFWDLPW